MGFPHTTARRRYILAATLAALLATGCEKQTTPPPKDGPASLPAERPRPAPAQRPVHRAALLLAQAQFEQKLGADGKIQTVPGAAKLTFAYPDGDGWTSEILEDPDSNVFHKAMPFDVPGGLPGILTIGANEAPKPAIAKIWRRTRSGWTGVILSQATFDGRFNRYRDVEIADVTGDAQPEIVIATHDQGAVGVLEKKGQRWEATLIDQALNTFVHEIEIGDVDGDGLNEIFATPSAPNRRDNTLQPGQVIMYRYDGRQFTRQVVDAFEDRHAKEILIANVLGPGPPNLYAVVEPRYNKDAAPTDDGPPVEIKEYRFTNPDPDPDPEPGPEPAANVIATVIATLPDKKCRFLHAGDVDDDGQVELVASAFKSGLWMIKHTDSGWETHLIDADSSGYEHASTLADLDGDGHLEIYVADDNGHRLRRYRWTGQDFDRTDLLDLTKGDITFGLTPCLNPRCLTAPQ